MGLLDSVRKDAAPSDDSGEDFVDLSSIKASIQGGRKGIVKKGAAKTSDVVTATDAEEKILSELMTAENFEEVCALPFNLRYVATGHKNFLLSDKQKKSLSLSLSTSFRLMVKIDPRWLAVGLTVVNFLAIYGEKEMEWQMIRKREGKTKEAK